VLLALALAFLGSNARAECVPTALAESKAIAAWAKEIDYIGREVVRQPQPGDRVTSFGTVIDGSCFAGLSVKDAEQKLDFISRSIGFALTQSRRCEKAFGLPAYGEVMPHLRRATIYCSKDAESPILATANQNDPQDSTKTAGWSQRWEIMDFNVNAFIGSSGGGIARAAATLAHEALHWGSNGNRAWHSDALAKKKNWEGCADSVLADRVYLLEAACFPTSSLGEELRRQLQKGGCPEICESAFSESERSKLLEQGVSEQTIGPALSKSEARKICTRIKDQALREKRVTEQMVGLVNRWDEATRWMNVSLGTTEWFKVRKELEQQLAEAGVDDKAKNYGLGRERRLEYVRQVQATYRAFVQAHCSKRLDKADGNDRPWIGFCAMKETPFDAWFKEATAVFQDFDQEAFEFLGNR